MEWLMDFFWFLLIGLAAGWLASLILHIKLIIHVLINMTGSGSNLLNTHIRNVIQGTLLGPNVGGTLEGTVGAVLLGQNFSLMTVTLTHP